MRSRSPTTGGSSSNFPGEDLIHYQESRLPVDGFPFFRRTKTYTGCRRPKLPEQPSGQDSARQHRFRRSFRRNRPIRKRFSSGPHRSGICRYATPSAFTLNVRSIGRPLGPLLYPGRNGNLEISEAYTAYELSKQKYPPFAKKAENRPFFLGLGKN